MTRSGTAATSASKTSKPSSSHQERPAAVPEQVVDFTAFGLRHGADGYQLVKVTVAGETCTVSAMRQAEPQRAVAFGYLEAAVADAYLETRG